MAGVPLTLSAAELTLLLAGIDLTRTRHRKWWSHPPEDPQPLPEVILPARTGGRNAKKSSCFSTVI